MINILRRISLRIRRNYGRNDTGMIARLLRSDLVRWNSKLVARGAAVGMFWAFIPIPFQMFPAALFCWLIRANLPIAIICVWLSNPVTLPPIIVLEYAIGRWIAEQTVSFGFLQFLHGGSAIASGLQAILAGALVLSFTAMLVSYIVVSIAFYFSKRQRLKERLAHMQKIAERVLHHRKRKRKISQGLDSD